MDTFVQIAGSLLILVPFVLVQMGRLTSTHWAFLTLNLFGSGVLVGEAAFGRQWGFLLLEGVWAIVSAIGIVRMLRGKPGKESTH